METLAFVLWMLLWPLVIKLERVFDKQVGITYNRGDLILHIIGSIFTWLSIGIALWLHATK